MSGKSKHYITVGNKKYVYTLRSYKDEIFEDGIFFECNAANIAQPFLREDIPALLVDLPELILEEKRYRAEQKEIIRFRVAPEDKKAIEKKAVQKGYASVSSFLRDLALKA
ncbi:MAG: hypothetical protein ABH856_02290 [Patescibacteria group bacterium]|nr:hypothetical protein [Patescibacteria group bacterium]